MVTEIEGIDMSKKLSDEDGRVVDFLLERQDSEQPARVVPAQGVVVETSHLSVEHIETVQQILTLLNELPADDPPGDLKVRTLRRVDAATGVMHDAAAQPPPKRPEDSGAPI